MGARRDRYPIVLSREHHPVKRVSIMWEAKRSWGCFVLLTDFGGTFDMLKELVIAWEFGKDIVERLCALDRQKIALSNAGKDSSGVEFKFAYQHACCKGFPADLEDSLG